MVLLDGIVQVSGFTIGLTTGIIIFDVAPGAGVLVQVALELDVEVRFDTDHLQLNLLREGVGSWHSIPIIEKKPTT